TIIICFADAQTTLNSAARHPDRETPRVMVAAIVGSGKFALAVDGPAKLAGPNDQCVIQHTSLLEIAYQAGRRLVDAFALQRDMPFRIAPLACQSPGRHIFLPAGDLISRCRPACVASS